MKYKKGIESFLLSKGHDTIGLRCSVLGRGENNQIVLAKLKSEKLVFRIGMRSDLSKHMKREFLLLHHMQEYGPEALYFDDSAHHIPSAFTVLRYVEGRVLKKWHREHLILHAKHLAKLHSSTYSEKRKKVSLIKDLKEEVAGYDSATRASVKDLHKKVVPFLESREHLFLKMNHTVHTHRDLGVNNILFHNSKFTYIDWEWSGRGDNAVDLAKFYCSDKLLDWKIKLTGERLELFLKTYERALRFKDPTLRARIEAWQVYSLFTDLMYVKWKLKHWKTEKKPYAKREYVEVALRMEKALHELLH